MFDYIERKEQAPKAIYLQWKDDSGEPLGETTWCSERVFAHDIRYILDKRHLTSQSSGRDDCAHNNRVHGEENDWCADCGYFPLSRR